MMSRAFSPGGRSLSVRYAGCHRSGLSGDFLELKGGQYHDTISSLKPRFLFDLTPFFGLVRDPAQHLPPQIRMSHLPPPKNDGYFGLIPLFQETLDVPKLKIEIMFFGLRPHLHLLQVNDDLFLSRLLVLFTLLIFKFSIIHDAANGWFRFGGDLHEVQLEIGSGPQCLHQGYDAQLFALRVNDPYLPRPNFPIDANVLSDSFHLLL